MKFRHVTLIIFAVLLTTAAHAQKTVVVVDPTKPVTDSQELTTATDQDEIDRIALPKLKARYQSDGCAVDLEFTGEATGSFTKKGAAQTIAFFQVCQTGNGLGVVAVIVTENGKVVGTFGSDSGWSFDIAALPDINGNGLDEFTLSFGGGMHQGQGGIGVDVMEFSDGMPKGLGWFKSEEMMDGEPTNVWKVTAKPGKVPVYYRQKFVSRGEEKYRRSGANAAFKLTKAYGKFEVVK